MGEVDTERLVVAVLTYRRPDRIAALVPALVEQAADLERSADDVTTSVLVVDNDAGGSGARAVAGLGATAVIEPEPGIAAARNRALEASQDDDLLVFIDDDEVPHEGWLRTLYRTYRKTRAAAVAGPVVSRYTIEPEPWVLAGGFYDRAHRRGVATGVVVPVAATNNLLLDLRVVRRAGLTFDPALGLSGGEDTHFTSALTAAGERIVWCAEAVVSDVVPVERLTRRYLLARSAGLANASARVALMLAPDGARRTLLWFRILGSCAARALFGAARVVHAAVRDDVGSDARGRRAVARSRGELLALFGKVLLPYAR